jgi:hypothetical protein
LGGDEDLSSALVGAAIWAEPFQDPLFYVQTIGQAIARVEQVQVPVGMASLQVMEGRAGIVYGIAYPANTATVCHCLGYQGLDFREVVGQSGVDSSAYTVPGWRSGFVYLLLVAMGEQRIILMAGFFQGQWLPPGTFPKIVGKLLALIAW